MSVIADQRNALCIGKKKKAENNKKNEGKEAARSKGENHGFGAKIGANIYNTAIQIFQAHGKFIFIIIIISIIIIIIIIIVIY